MPESTTTPSAPAIPPAKLTFAAVNSGLNATATVLLVVALIQIKRRNYRAHGTLMVAALITSAVFLASYLLSKFLFGEVTTAMVAGKAPGWAKGLYIFVLVPHLIAAVVMLPMIAKAVYHAYHRQWDKHRRIAKPTWYVWFYVSVSGVLVYVMLYHWLPSLAAAAG